MPSRSGEGAAYHFRGMIDDTAGDGSGRVRVMPVSQYTAPLATDDVSALALLAVTHVSP